MTNWETGSASSLGICEQVVEWMKAHPLQWAYWSLHPAPVSRERYLSDPRFLTAFSRLGPWRRGGLWVCWAGDDFVRPRVGP